MMSRPAAIKDPGLERRAATGGDGDVDLVDHAAEAVEAGTGRRRRCSATTGRNRSGSWPRRCPTLSIIVPNCYSNWSYSIFKDVKEIKNGRVLSLFLLRLVTSRFLFLDPANPGHLFQEDFQMHSSHGFGHIGPLRS